VYDGGDHGDQVLELNLENFVDYEKLKKRREARRFSVPRLDSWTANGSSLEHHTMAIAGCGRADVPAENRRECEAVAWADHLRACSNCWRQDSLLRIRNFAEALAAERGLAG
jgi:hypothetical protein